MIRFLIKTTEPSLGKGYVRFLSTLGNEKLKTHIDTVEYWEGVAFFDTTPLLCSILPSSTVEDPWEFQFNPCTFCNNFA